MKLTNRKTLFLLSLLTLSSCAETSHEHSWVVGMSYHEARELVIQDGWEPVQAIRSEMDAKYRLPHFYYDAGYTEVTACSGTKMGYCDFRFENAEGEYLTITTQGGDYVANDEHPPTVVYAGVSEDPDD